MNRKFPLSLSVISLRLKRTAWLLAAAVLIVQQTPGFVEAQQAKSPNKASAKISLNRSPKAKSVEVPATVSAVQTVDLFSKVGGFLSEINVDIGDEFSAGDVLAKLNIPEMETDVVQKEAMLEQAKAEAKQAVAAVNESKAKLASFQAAITEAGSIRAAKNAKLQYEIKECNRLTQMAQSSSIRGDLVDASILKVQSAESDLASVSSRVATAEANLLGAKAAVEKSRADVVAAESRVRVAEANLKHAKQLMSYATVTAPWNGVVLDRHVDAGAFIQSAAGNSAASPLLKIARVDSVRVTFALSGSDIADLDKGDRAVLTRIDALPGEEFTGVVARFSGGLDPQTRILKVEVDLPNQDRKLKPGYFGYLKVYLEE